MTKHRIYTTSFASVYPHYVTKAERKGRTNAEVHTITRWLTGYTEKQLAWVALFKKTFKFTGGEIVAEFLMSIGYLPGAHTSNCPIMEKILKQKPMWSRRS